MNPRIVRQGSPTVDGAEEILYFLVDPLTGLRVRVPASAAFVFVGLERRTNATTEEIQAMLGAAFGVRVEADAVRGFADLFSGLELSNPARTLDSQLTTLHTVIVDRAKARVLRQLPEVRATIPFYAHYPDDPNSFESLPLIGKVDLRERLHELYVRNDGAGYFWTSSSGTTGERVQSPHSPESYFHGVLPLMAAGAPEVEFSSDSRWVMFLPAECGGMACNMNPDSSMAERTMLGRVLFAPQLGNPTIFPNPQLERCATEIAEFRPTIISGSPSFIHAFACYAQSVGLSFPSLRALFFHVEPPSLIHERRIEAALGLRGRSLYIVSELGWCAVERLPGRMFSSPDHVVEILREGRPAGPGEIGRVVISRAVHGSAVLLRYDTGDLARLSDDGVTFSRILGRKHNGVVALSDGTELGIDVIDTAIADAAEDFVDYYRLHRRGSRSSPRFVLDCCLRGDAASGGVLEALSEALRKRIRVTVDIRRVAGIPPYRGGRMPLFLDEISE